MNDFCGAKKIGENDARREGLQLEGLSEFLPVHAPAAGSRDVEGEARGRPVPGRSYWDRHGFGLSVFFIQHVHQPISGVRGGR